MDIIQTIDKLKEVFTPIADKIGQGAEFGWEIVVRQQIAYGIVLIFVAIVGIIVIIAGYRISKILEDEGLVLVTSFMVGGTMFITGSIYGILYLINPHYYAIQFFLNLVSGN